MHPDFSPRKAFRHFRLLPRGVGLVWRSAPGWTLVSAALVLALSLLPLANLYLMKRIVDFISNRLMVGGAVEQLQPLLLWLGLALAVAVLTALCRALSEVATQAQSLRVTDAVFDRLHAQSIALDLEYYEDPAYFDSLHRAQQEAPYRPAHIFSALTQIAQNGLSLLGIAGLLFAFYPLLGLLLFIAVLPGALLRVIYAGKNFDLQQRQTESERHAWYYHWLLVDSNFAKEVRLFGLGGLFKQRFHDLRQAIRDGKLALVRSRAGLDFLAQAFSHLTVFSVLGLAAFQALRGHLSLGDVLIVFMGYQSGLGFMGSALQGLSGLYEDSLFLSNFYDFLALQPAIQAPPHPRPLPSPFRRALVFEDVTFCYPQGIAPALQGVNLTLEPGQVIALVGENGSGKTTLVKLLCRLYDPTAGRITLDGIDLRDLDPLRWRAEISVIFQDFIHYHLPAWENIWFGDVGRPPDRDAIRRAALASGIHPAISRLPRDYDTALGTWFEEGHELSTGEWQKLALARMFLRQANLIVLDEPTSALDPLAEADLFYRFRRLVGSRTAILISHRFSTVQMADLIYVLKGGQLVESGSHAELLHLDGYYAGMYRAQAGLYASEPAYAL